MGYAACLAASDEAVAQGNVGAGTGCSAGKLLGARHATKTGIGSAAIELGGGLVVAALIAVNPFGDVVDEAGRIIAGTRPLRTGPLRGEGYADTLALLRGMTGRLALRIAGATVIGVVATNARLDKEQVNKVAQMAQDGLARTIRPAHTLFDGDTLFALATGRVRASVTLVGAYAAEAVAQAIWPRRSRCCRRRAAGRRRMCWMRMINARNRHAATSGEIAVWQTQIWPEMTRLTTPPGSPSRLIVSPNGQRLAALIQSGQPPSRIVVWDTSTWRVVSQFPLADVGWDIAFSPDGRWLVAGLGQGAEQPALYEGQLWDASNGQLVAHMPHAEQVLAVAFSADGKRIATGGHDAVKIWGVHMDE